MNSFDLTSIYVANGIGAVLLCILLMSNVWRLRERRAESVYLIAMMVATLFNCIVDPLVYSLDGMEGELYRFLNYAGNTWLYVGTLAASYTWVSFVECHMNGSISKKHSIVLKAVVFVCLIGLVVNLFYPMVFDVDDKNVYVRKSMYMGYLAVNYGLLVDAIVVYLKSKGRGGLIKYFPVWSFVIPVVIGSIVQSMYYGVSVSAVSMAISVAGVLASLQNEQIYKDSLTGLYNRTYLDHLLKRFSRKNMPLITGVMLDLNGFKRINDTYGHGVGDHALVDAAEILKRVIGKWGLAIRYAGDEFILLVNTQDERLVYTIMSEIRRNMKVFNETSHKPYQLSVSMGSCKLDFGKTGVDDFINEIDHRMYEDKRDFYANNLEADRRSRKESERS